MKRLLTLILISNLFLACSNDDTEQPAPQVSGNAAITFDTRAGTSDFALNKDFTVGNRSYNFTKLRYWISNVILTDTKGTEYKVPDSYYLMEEVGELDLTGTINPGKMIYPAKKRETINLEHVPAADYKTITFSIGIDPRYNDNLSLQSGELSIANGMSNIAWMWHSSYIFSSAAGTVKEGAEIQKFLAETGLNANFKTVKIDLANPVNFSTASDGLVLNVDITKIFDGVDVLKNPAVNAASPLLMSAVAENYAKAITPEAMK